MKRLIIGIVIILLLAAVGVTAWHLMPIRHAFYTDAETIRAPASSAPIRDILWEPPRLLPPMINTGEDVYEPRLSADGTTLFFVRGKAGENADIFVSRQTYEGWSEATPLGDVNSPYEDLGPEPSTDGKSLYFYSDRPGGLGGYDLWVAYVRGDGRSDNGWHEPVNLGPAVNSTFNDYGPALTPDTATLYFASNRPLPTDARQPNPDAWPATLREDLFRRTYDLYAASITDAGPGRAEPIAELNTAFNEGAPAVSAFGDFLYFSSDRPGGAGAFDLYRCRRLRGSLVRAENLGEAVNTRANELDPGMSLGGFRLYFSSDRVAAGQRVTEQPEYRLYSTSSREVFRETESESRPPIDWAALWSKVGPSLLWLLLATLLLLLLLALMRGLRERRMSLLAKCLLASLLAHLALMLLLTLWGVTAAIAGEFRRGGPIRVALGSGVVATELAIQIRGSMTEIDASQAMEAPGAPRWETPARFVPEPSMAEMAVERQTILMADHSRVVMNVEDSSVAVSSIREPARRELVIPESLTTIDVQTPSQPEPSRFSEAEMKVPQQSLASAVTERATIVPQASENDVRSVEMKVAPTALRESADRPLTATSFEVRESLPANTSTRQRTSMEMAGVVPPMPDGSVLDGSLNLTGLRAPTPEQAGEIASPVSIPALVEVPRGGVVMGSLNQAAAPTAAILPPARTAAMKESSMVGAEWASRVAEATPKVTPRQMEWRDATTDVSPATIDIDIDVELPTTASGASARVEEAAFETPASAWVSTARRVEPRYGRSGSPSAPAPAARIDPARSTEPLGEASMISTGLSSLRDTTWPTTAPWTLARANRETPLAAIEFDVPSEELPPESAYVQRTSPDRMDIVERTGGSAETENAVAKALQWLARHQHRDGHWDASDFDAGCGECGGTTDIAADIALTGLSTLCFLGAGHTHARDGEYRNNVERALQWLLRQQKPDGDLRGSETLYTQGIATIAISEAFAMTDDSRLGEAVARSVRFIYRARNRNDGGWRYDPGQAGDTSVLGWQVMALKSASMTGIAVPRESFETARRWLNRVSSPTQPGLYAYMPGRPFTPSMTAEGMFVQQLLGAARDSARMRGSAEFIIQHLPDWETDANTYYWYYAALALYQHQGEAWDIWNQALTRELLEHQRKDGKAEGSWDPDGEWAKLGGRVYQTALCTLMLEVYYRYLPLYALDVPTTNTQAKGHSAPVADAIGAVRGSITDANTGEPLKDAVVRLSLSDREAITVETDRRGDYELSVPEVPDFFAISASKEGYVPESTNVEAARLKGRTITVNFELRREGKEVIVTEVEPELHHLGDDRFDGTINSQFQKRSEGASWRAEFSVSAEQLPPQFTRGEVRLLVKGVQRRHTVFVNDTKLEKRLDDAPEDGSFGEFRAPFQGSVLREGNNTVAVVAAPSDVDIDDFEFVNMQIHLFP